MRHGSATVAKATGPLRLTVTVRVAVERPDRPEDSYLRCAGDAPAFIAAAALSGARFARGVVDRDRFGIAVLEIAGNLDAPAASEGVALAAVYAVWRAWGRRGSDAEVGEVEGWTLDEPDA